MQAPSSRLLVLPACLLLAAVCAFPGAAGATEVWRWKDASGITQYGERPPEGVEAERVALRPEPSIAPLPAAAAPPPPAEDESVDLDDPVDAARQRAVDANAEARRLAREANCQRARLNLQVLRSEANVSVRDGAEARTLNAEERAAELAANEEAERLNCEPQAEGGG
ncbi:MAG: DUF4124 domain-containing protein [Aquimonas sp.]|nr:DUF4124 domain-containing protein [Aquimonas sp.]